MIGNMPTVDELPLGQLVGEGHMIKPKPNDTEIALKQLKSKWNEDCFGKTLLINTGGARGFNREFQYEFPRLTLDTVDFLIKNKMKVIGIDTLGIEPFSLLDFNVHKAPL
ncbi:MAG: cyclase family protein [Candidatus Parvarchaeota archaeon]